MANSNNWEYISDTVVRSIKPIVLGATIWGIFSSVTSCESKECASGRGNTQSEVDKARYEAIQAVAEYNPERLRTGLEPVRLSKLGE